MLSFFSPEYAKYDGTGQVRSGCPCVSPSDDFCDLGFYGMRSALAAPNDAIHVSDLPRTGIFCAFASIFRQDDLRGWVDGSSSACFAATRLIHLPCVFRFPRGSMRHLWAFLCAEQGYAARVRGYRVYYEGI